MQLLSTNDCTINRDGKRLLRSASWVFNIIQVIFTENQNQLAATINYISNMFRPDVLAIFRESCAAMFQLVFTNVVFKIIKIGL
jgi:hypothetical protein